MNKLSDTDKQEFEAKLKTDRQLKLDVEKQKIVMEAVNNLSKNTTIILISHRLSTVKNCDMKFLLEKSEIKNHGTFEELIKLNESFRINATN